jgi:hypothetical protein
VSVDSIDWDKALLIAGGSSVMRDLIVDGVLNMFAECGELSPLFAIPTDPEDVQSLRELSHRAVGLAKQGAMPALEVLCTRLHASLVERRFKDAASLGPAMREERRNIHRAVSVFRGGR